MPQSPQKKELEERVAAVPFILQPLIMFSYPHQTSPSLTKPAQTSPQAAGGYSREGGERVQNEGIGYGERVYRKGEGNSIEQGEGIWNRGREGIEQRKKK